LVTLYFNSPFLDINYYTTTNTFTTASLEY